ncbi:hypothetical protein QQP08_013026 [Theobroma cacao]|nr:hypothetical protein QQP08_013026 [Theobroma cacao]
MQSQFYKRAGETLFLLKVSMLVIKSRIISRKLTMGLSIEVERAIKPSRSRAGVDHNLAMK